MFETEEIIDPFRCAAIPDIEVDAVDGSGAQVGISMICPLVEECGLKFNQTSVVNEEQISQKIQLIREQLSSAIDRNCLAKNNAETAGAPEKYTPPPGVN